MSRDANRNAAGLKFYFKESVEQAPEFVQTPASNRGYLIGLSVRGNHRRRIIRQHHSESYEFSENSIYVRDFRDDFKAQLEGSFSFVLLEVSPAALDEISDSTDVKPVAELKQVMAAKDETLAGLTRAIFPSATRHEQSALFLDQMSRTIGMHLLRSYGISRSVREPRRSGLSSRQERIAKELLRSNLRGDLTIADIARECSLSPGAFMRGFKQTTGLSPTQWLLDSRLSYAKNLMLRSAFSLAEIALLSGFSSQAYFTRAFAARYGQPPASWRDRRR